MGRVKLLFGSLRASLLVRNTVWMGVSGGMRSIIQAGYFVLLARCLSSGGYGAFVATVAIVAIASPFSGIGAGNLLVQNVARDRRCFRKYWGQALLLTLVSGSILLISILLLWWLFLRQLIPLIMILAIATADLFFSRIVDIAGQAFQALERLGQTAKVQTLFNTARLVAALFLVFVVRSPTPTKWALLYLGSSAACAAIVIWLVNRELGLPELRWQGSREEIWTGLHFSFGLSAQGIYNDIDKSMLAKLSTLEATGIYGAAYRVIDAAFTPVRALLAAAYARFFQHGARGLNASVSYARKLLPMATVYALVAGMCLALASPLLPMLLGPSYGGIVEVVRWLAILPLIRTIHYFAADSLTGAGQQGLRSVVQVVVAVLNILLNLWLIPAYSWRGAAWVSLISDGALAVGLWAMVLIIRNRQAIHELISHRPAASG